LHLHMLECDKDPKAEGSGAMLFRTLKLMLMLLPQSSCYNVLRDRLTTVSRFRQSAIAVSRRATLEDNEGKICVNNEAFVERIYQVRALHCGAKWQLIRAESLKEEANEKQRHQEIEKKGVDDYCKTLSYIVFVLIIGQNMIIRCI